MSEQVDQTTAHDDPNAEPDTDPGSAPDTARTRQQSVARWLRQQSVARWLRQQSVARWLRQQWALGVLVILIAVFGITHPNAFLSGDNLTSIAVNASGYLIVAIGMTFVITIAGIDLGVGSVLVFAGVLSVKAMVAIGGSGIATMAVGLVVALIAGAAWGLIGGLVITRTAVQPLIATLGTLFAALGLAQVITGGVDLTGVPAGLVSGLGFGTVLGVPYTVLLGLAVAAVGGFVMNQTRFGRHTSAIGSNEEAARRAAINVSRHVTSIYVLCGMLAGLAGFVSLARFSTTTINGHQTDMLQAVLAVVIGGTSLSGGVARMAGTVIGVCIPATLQSGFVIVGIQPFWQNVAMGLALVVVVAIDQRRRLALNTR
ncbi:ABC transporter permease [Williamsia sp. CHRR-6]|uniref:ABC transporter permease n=1 Tax=Williamsia sp. CHRR-6 TaxID=2835871 RepID=UPI001BDABDF7|nr:ABC transporter permease [Williamsia sp. CHRR-6]MBT0566401.1 ABC transporter permease [Williamsia sp. CHRR-6]